MCDIIEKCDECNIPGDLILLDFEKAFDSVEWNFIRKSLEFWGLVVQSGLHRNSLKINLFSQSYS
jgi:hypothetical protein